MNLPAYPTDNLYKFVAIAGLIIAGYCAFFAHQQLWEIRLQISRAATEEELLNTVIDRLDKQLDRLLEKRGIEHIPPEVIKEMEERAVKMLEKSAQLAGKKREIVILSSQFDAYVYGLVIWFIIGLLLSYKGFELWYWKVQKPSDELMAKRLSDPETRNQDTPDK